jgi:hypothetical protein
MAKKTIVGQVANSVTDAVASAIDAIAHPMTTAAKARKAMGRTATSTKRKVTAKKKAAKKAVKKAASKTRRAATKAKRAVKKVAKKAAKKVRRR